MQNLKVPEMSWCRKCVYPISAAVTLSIDEEGICSGCRTHEQKKDIDWDERLQILLEEVEPYRKSSGYECDRCFWGERQLFSGPFVKES